VTSARAAAGAGTVQGPYHIERSDLGPLNALFSDAFTERYRRDGLVGVRVPPLNPLIWRYAIEDAADGAMLWRDLRGQIVAFNLAHRCGTEGWMGPLAVREDHQGMGVGTTIVTAGVEFLRRSGCTVIGLETMPRTMENIGFYARLGFLPSHLTITVTLDATRGGGAPRLLSGLPGLERAAMVDRCRALVHGLRAGHDYTREMILTHDLALGDTVLVLEGDTPIAFALCHWAPLVEGRDREELRVLKLVARDATAFDALLPHLTELASRSGTQRVAMRVQGAYRAVFSRLVGIGGRVRWTDLRMALRGAEETEGGAGVVLSNWEI
jgi:GNAT superfamily N-acetyltransferase